MRPSVLALTAFVLASSLSADEASRLLIHRIGPAKSTIFVSNADGTQERQLLPSSALDYNAALSFDGQWIAFTSERDGSADIYRVKIDGSGLERLTNHSAYDDQAAWSPDGRSIAFVSTRASGTNDVWTLDLATKALRNVTATPGGDFRPAWSPDGQWIAFTSDRGTQIERNLPAWEHLQRTSIFVVHPNGEGLRRVTDGERFAGSPRWSADGSRLVFYDVSVVDTHRARTGGAAQIESQVVSVNVSTGMRQVHASGTGIKVSPQYVFGDRIGYVVRGGPEFGVHYSDGTRGPAGAIRNPSWTRDGAIVVYDRGRGPGSQGYELLQPLYSSNPAFQLSHLASMGAYSHDGRRLALSERVIVDGVSTNDVQGVKVMDASGTNGQRIFFEPKTASMSPQWSPDDQSIIVGVGGGFQSRGTLARIVVMKPDGSNQRTLTSAMGAGFPSMSPDGKWLVFRVWGPGADERGLRVLNIDSGAITRLTSSEYDTFPGWSPAGDVIAFSSWRNGDFDIYTIRPDSTGEKRLTTTSGNDAHSSWSPDGKYLMFSSSRLGFKDEAPLYDGQPQPYGEIFVMKFDGSDQRQLTDNRWEDGPGTWQPKPRVSSAR